MRIAVITAKLAFLLVLFGGLLGNLLFFIEWLNGQEVRSWEILDKFVFLGLGLAIIFGGISSLSSSNSDSIDYEASASKLFPILAFISVATIAIPTNLWLEDQASQWTGFGLRIAIALVLFKLLIDRLPSPYPKLQGGGTLVALFSAMAALLLIQPSWGLSDDFHALHLHNDLLSWTTGNESFYVSQYTDLLSPVFASLLKFVGLQDSLLSFQFSTVFATASSLMAFTSFVLSLALIVPRSHWSYMAVAVFPLMLASNEISSLGSILTSVTLTSSRMSFTLLGIALIVMGAKHLSTKLIFLSGLVGGMGVVNNLEFGIVFAIAVGLTLAINYRSSPKFFSSFATGTILGLGLGLLILSSQGVDLVGKLSLIGGFSGAQTGSPFPVLGFHLLVFPFFTFSVIWFLKKSWYAPEFLHFLGLAFSIMGIGHLGYFVTISSASIQLQASFFALALLVAVWLAFAVSGNHVGSVLGRAVTATFVALGLAISLFALPQPRQELVRLSPNTLLEITGTYSSDDLETTVSLVQELKQKHEELGIYVMYGNIVESLTGVGSMSRLTDPRNEAIYGLYTPCEAFNQYAKVLAVREHDGRQSSKMQDCGWRRSSNEAIPRESQGFDLWYNPSDKNP